MIIDANKNSTTYIGRVGENMANTIRFDIADIQREYPDATFAFLNQRPKDPAAYPVLSQNISIVQDKLLWVVTSGDLTEDGIGKCEIIAYDGSVIVKDETYMTSIKKSLDGSGTAPDPWQSYVQQVVEAATEAEAAADRAEAAVLHSPVIEDDVWFVWDAEAEEYVSTGVHAQGETGATPDFSIGTVTTGEPGSDAVVNITGTAENPVLNMTIPRGDRGEKGDSVLVATLIDGDDYVLESEVSE